MNVIKKIFRFLSWFVYFRLTIHDRDSYMHSKRRGGTWVKTGHGLSYDDYRKIGDEPPKRNFLTFKEYMSI